MIDFSDRGRARVWVTTLCGTLLCLLIALVVAAPGFSSLNEEQLRRSLTITVGLPILLAGPLLFLLLSKIRLLAIAHDNMSKLASMDGLTQVFNRGAFQREVERHLQQAEHNGKFAPHLLIIDVDHFKSINDNFGHETGDKALRIIAATIKENVRQTDIVGRIGGEEFAVFLSHISTTEALSIADRIRLAVSEVEMSETNSCPISISIGGAPLRGHQDYDSVFRIADRRLYKAKNSGRNQICLAD